MFFQTCLYVKHDIQTSLVRMSVGAVCWCAIASQKNISASYCEGSFWNNVTHSSKYSKHDENPIRNQSLTLLRVKCQAPALILLANFAALPCQQDKDVSHLTICRPSPPPSELAICIWKMRGVLKNYGREISYHIISYSYHLTCLSVTSCTRRRRREGGLNILNWDRA